MVLENEDDNLKIAQLTFFLFKVMGNFLSQDKSLILRLTERILKGIEGVRMPYEKNEKILQILIIFAFSKIQKRGSMEMVESTSEQFSKISDSKSPSNHSKINFFKNDDAMYPKRQLSKIDRFECSIKFLETIFSQTNKNIIDKNFFVDLLLSFISDSLLSTQLKIIFNLSCSFLSENYHLLGNSFLFFSDVLSFLQKNLLITQNSFNDYEEKNTPLFSKFSSTEKKINSRDNQIKKSSLYKSNIVLSNCLHKEENPFEKAFDHLLLSMSNIIQQISQSRVKDDYEDVLEFDFSMKQKPLIKLIFDKKAGRNDWGRTSVYSFSFFCYFDYCIRPSGKFFLWCKLPKI